MTPLPSDGATLVPRLLRRVGVLATFAVVGPAIGGLLVFCCLLSVAVLLGFDTTAARDAAQPSGYPNLESVAGSVVLFVALGYAFGAPQAVLTGLWAAFATFRHGTFSGRGTALAAIAATLLWIALLYSPMSPITLGDAGDADRTANAAKAALALTPVGVVCAFVVRWLCLRLQLILQRASP